MKLILPFFIFIFLLSLEGCSSKENKMLQWKINDFSDLHMYNGSQAGAQEVDLQSVVDKIGHGSIDSLKEVFLTQYFKKKYNKDLYRFLTAKFFDTELSYTFEYPEGSNIIKRIISTYTFKGDSLFIYQGRDKKTLFVGLGNNDRLYRNISLGYYPDHTSTPAKNVVMTNETGHLNLDSMIVRSGLKNKTEMIDPKDTIVYCNLKYIFE